MKKEASRHPDSRFHIICPFCGTLNDRFTAITFCGNRACLVEWHRTRDGRYIFDTCRKTERFAWAKAVVGSGGTRMGTASRDEG
jgi:hypothetical protein